MFIQFLCMNLPSPPGDREGVVCNCLSRSLLLLSLHSKIPTFSRHQKKQTFCHRSQPVSAITGDPNPPQPTILGQSAARHQPGRRPPQIPPPLRASPRREVRSYNLPHTDPTARPSPYIPICWRESRHLSSCPIFYGCTPPCTRGICTCELPTSSCSNPRRGVSGGIAAFRGPPAARQLPARDPGAKFRHHWSDEVSQCPASGISPRV